MAKKKPFLFVLLAFLLLTVLVRPWRDSVSQDDSAYAYSAISVTKGGELHAGNVAMIYPQLAAGFVALKTLPLPELSALNFATWLCYGLVIAIMFHVLKVPAIFLLSFFFFPIWTQYGASYLSEMYSGVLFVALLWCLHARKGRAFELPLIFFLSLALGTQIQNMAAFPFGWGAVLLLKKIRGDKKAEMPVALALIAGSLLSLIAFAAMEKTPFQQGYGYWSLRLWQDYGSGAVKMFFVLGVQLIAALGLYLVPTVSLRKISARQMGLVVFLQVIYVWALLGARIPAMHSGVFFVSQVSSVLSFVFVSFGVWGWLGVAQNFSLKEARKDQAIPIEGTVLALLAMLLFSIFRHALDIRYVVTWSLIIMFHIRYSLRSQSAESQPIGSNPAYLVAVGFVSVLLNLYSLNTTEARWTVARELEATGVSQDTISAGVGRDSFLLETPCAKNIIEKLTATESAPIWKSDAFYRRIISQYNKSHADEWTPAYIIKPSQMLGYKFQLQRNLLPGQEKEPERYFDYKVFGIPNQLAIYHNAQTQAAWCFR